MREIFCILFLGFVALLTRSPVVVATDSIKNPEFDPVETPIIASAGDTTVVTRLLRRESGTTNDNTTDVDKKALFVDILMLSGPEIEERNVLVLQSIVGAVFKVLGKFVSPATLERWQANSVEFFHAIAYKLGTTPVGIYAKARKIKNPVVREKYEQAAGLYAVYYKKRSGGRPQP